MNRKAVARELLGIVKRLASKEADRRQQLIAKLKAYSEKHGGGFWQSVHPDGDGALVTFSPSSQARIQPIKGGWVIDRGRDQVYKTPRQVFTALTGF